MTDKADPSRGAKRGWRFFCPALGQKNTTPLPLDGSEVASKKMEMGVALDALFESNTLATFFGFKIS